MLRSFTKFYAMPGLRVGYAIAPADMVTRLRQYQDPWTVYARAEAAAIAALDDSSTASGRRLDPREAARFVDRLWEIPGLRPAWPDRSALDCPPPCPTSSSLSLTRTDWDSIRLHEALARRGILVRECSDFPGLEVGALVTGPGQLVATQGHIRVAVKTPELNDRLVAALADLLASGPAG